MRTISPRLSLLLAGLLSGCQAQVPMRSPAGNGPPTAGAATHDSAATPDHLTATLYLKGMSCPLCATNIDKQLLRVRGVTRVTVDLGSGQVLATLSQTGPPTRDQLVQAVLRSGFTLERIEMPAPQGSAP